MKNRYTSPFFLVICCCLSGPKVGAQQSFQHLHTVADSVCTGFSIAPTDDGHLWIGGGVATKIAALDYQFDGVIWKMTAAGDPVWTLRISRENNYELYIIDMIPLADNGCIAIMNYHKFQTEIGKPTVMRLNKDGEIIWAKQFNTEEIYFSKIRQISDGFLIEGSINAPDNTYLIKIDDAGNVIWKTCLSGFKINLSGLYEYPNGDLVLPGGRVYGIWMKLAADGQIINVYQYLDPTVAQSSFGLFLSCQPAGDSLIFFGRSVNGKLLSVKTDHNGNAGSAFRFTVPDPNFLSPFCVLGDADEGYFLGCYGSILFGSKPYLVHISPDLEPKWMRAYGKNDGSELFVSDIKKTKNGFGLTGHHATGVNLNMYLAQTDSNGEITGECCSKSLEITRLPCPIKKEIPNYTLRTLADAADLSPVTWKTTTNTTLFCEKSAKPVLSDSSICPALCAAISLNGAKPNSKYTWRFPGGIPDTSSLNNPGNVCYPEFGVFPVYLQEDGCLIDSLSITVDNPADQFPNAFTPNNDGVNETFKPLISCPVDEFVLEIYNRWGDKIFQTTDPETGWDGNVNGRPAPVDTYVYRVQYFRMNGTDRVLVKNEMKEVTLLR